MLQLRVLVLTVNTHRKNLAFAIHTNRATNREMLLSHDEEISLITARLRPDIKPLGLGSAHWLPLR